MSRLTSSPVATGLSTGSPPAHGTHARVAPSVSSFLELRMIPWLGLGGGVLLALFAPALTYEINWMPFLISLFVLGMPHGAMDWFVQNRLGDVQGLFAQTVVDVLLKVASLSNGATTNILSACAAVHGAQHGADRQRRHHLARRDHPHV